MVGPRDEPVPGHASWSSPAPRRRRAATPIATTCSDSSGAFSVRRSDGRRDAARRRRRPPRSTAASIAAARAPVLPAVRRAPPIWARSGSSRSTCSIQGRAIVDRIGRAGHGARRLRWRRHRRPRRAPLGRDVGSRDPRRSARRSVRAPAAARRRREALVAAGDLTLDGATDLVVGLAGGRAIVLRNDGDGDFEATEDHALGAGAGAGQPRIGDFDSDGHPDVLFAQRSEPQPGARRSATATARCAAPALFRASGRARRHSRSATSTSTVGSTSPSRTSNASAPHAVIVLRGDGAGGFGATTTLSFSLPPVQIEARPTSTTTAGSISRSAPVATQRLSAFVAPGSGDGTFALAVDACGQRFSGWPISMAIDDLDARRRARSRRRPRSPAVRRLPAAARRRRRLVPFPTRTGVISDSCSAPPRLALSRPDRRRAAGGPCPR